MFPYMLLVCLAAVLIGMANARGHFFVPALGAVVLNVVMIASVLLLAPRMGPRLGASRSSAWPLACCSPGWPRPSSSCRAFHAKATATNGSRPGATPPSARSSARCCPARLASPPSRSTCCSPSASRSGSTRSIVATFNYSVRLMELPARHVRHLARHLPAADARRVWPPRRSTPSSAQTLQPGIGLPGLRQPHRRGHRPCAGRADCPAASSSAANSAPTPPCGSPWRWPAWRRAC